MSNNFYTWLNEVRCTTAREVAGRFGLKRKSAYSKLDRLAKLGVLEKRFVKRAVLFCIKEGAELPPPRKPRRTSMRVRERAEKALGLLSREGCATFRVLSRALGVGHTPVRYVMTLLLSQGRVVETIIGGTAIWCKDRETALELVTKLRETVYRLTARFRYITPRRVLHMITQDKEAYALFSKFVSLRPAMYGQRENFSAQTLAFVGDILRSLYGDPVKYSPHKNVFTVTQPRQGLGGIVVRDGADVERVKISLPSDLAEALKGANAEEVVLQAIRQLLEQYGSPTT
jgi:DNA-binding Lrp family transcriptional regulator